MMTEVAEQIVTAAEKLLSLPDGHRPLIVAIDGRCAAGKTTLARQLQDMAGWSIFHMDDFFLRAEQRTEARLRTPGGNVDVERFLEEILVPLKDGNTQIVYRRYDCHSQRLSDSVYTKAGPVCLVEGSYSCHPALRDYYDCKVFLSVAPEEQKHRVTVRNGEAEAVSFTERWIPLEEQYFQAFEIEKNCDMRFEM